MISKDSFLQKAHIGKPVELMTDAGKIIGKISSLNMSEVAVKDDEGNEYFVSLDSVSAYSFNGVAENAQAAEEIKFVPSGIEGLSAGIESVGFSVRTASSLARAGYKTLGELAGKTTDELLKIRNLGSKGVKEVIEVCNRFLTED